MKGESSNIFNWLGMKQEEEALSLSTHHIMSVLLCAKTFQEAINAFSKGEKKQKEEALLKVRKYEQEADKLRVDLVKRISEGVVAPVDREELLKFVLTADRVADWINGAARLLCFLEKPFPNGIMKNIKESVKNIVMAVENLKDCVDALIAGKNKEAIELSIKVHEIESAEDDRKQDSLGKILASDLPTPQLLVSYNLIEYLEGITDKIEDASDSIKVIAVKSR
ncbi:MAG: DUF47 family protein [Candidatus Omnitrophica bacterium]|nr:DUF47 family protein [Candidatus Omnitrophota bacterium]